MFCVEDNFRFGLGSGVTPPLFPDLRRLLFYINIPPTPYLGLTRPPLPMKRACSDIECQSDFGCDNVDK